MMGEWGGMMGTWNGWGMSIGMVIWTVALVLIVVLAVRALTTIDRRPSESRDDGERHLRRRFASGEIDRDEYVQRLAVLRGKP